MQDWLLKHFRFVGDGGTIDAPAHMEYNVQAGEILILVFSIPDCTSDCLLLKLLAC